MRSRFRRLLPVLTLALPGLFLLAPEAQGQRRGGGESEAPPRRTVTPGPWVSVAAGVGARMEEIDFLLLDRFGGAGNARAAWTFPVGVAVGGEWSLQRFDSNLAPVDRESWLLIGVLRLPGNDAGFYKVGVGKARATVVRAERGTDPREVPEATVLTADGVSVSVGTGSWVRVRRGIALSPGFDLYVQRVDDDLSWTTTASLGLTLGR